MTFVIWFLTVSGAVAFGWGLRGRFQSEAMQAAYKAGQLHERAARKWLDRTQQPGFLVRHEARR